MCCQSTESSPENREIRACAQGCNLACSTIRHLDMRQPRHRLDDGDDVLHAEQRVRGIRVVVEAELGRGELGDPAEVLDQHLPVVREVVGRRQDQHAHACLACCFRQSLRVQDRVVGDRERDPVSPQRGNGPSSTSTRSSSVRLAVSLTLPP